MRRLPTFALALLAAGLLTACPAFWVDRGELVAASHTLERPAADALPPADRYVELQDRWRREAQIGVGGAVVGILRDPKLVAAEVAHDAALQGLDRAATAAMLATTWATAFGPDLDRWCIDLDWRFDEQFVTHAEVLDAGTWTFVLHVDEQLDYAPIAVTTLAHSQVPEKHFWEGKIRLWFPWRDHERDRLLLGGNTHAVRLELKHPSGSGDLTWRFRGAY